MNRRPFMIFVLVNFFKRTLIKAFNMLINFYFICYFINGMFHNFDNVFIFSNFRGVTFPFLNHIRSSTFIIIYTFPISSQKAKGYNVMGDDRQTPSFLVKHSFNINNIFLF